MCESRMKVDPDLAFLGVTENISSMPPLFCDPSPTLIFILHIPYFTFIGSSWYSCPGKCAWAGGCGPAWTISRWACRVLWRWACLSPAGKKTTYHSKVIDSRIGSRSRLGRWQIARIPLGTPVFSATSIYPGLIYQLLLAYMRLFWLGWDWLSQLKIESWVLCFLSAFTNTSDSFRCFFCCMLCRFVIWK